MTEDFAATTDQPRPSENFVEINELFDHKFFLLRYGHRFNDLGSADPATAFAIYLRFVSVDQLDPNPEFSEARYLNVNKDVEAAVQDGSLLCGFQHWVNYGRLEMRQTFSAHPANDVIPAELMAAGEYKMSDLEEMLELFDDRHFRATSPFGFVLHPEADKTALFDIYLLNARHLPLQPQLNFLEEYYFLRNPDVREAVESGAFLCGFHHWAAFGRNENRASAPQIAKRPVELGRAEITTDPDKQRFKSLFQPAYYNQSYSEPDTQLSPDLAFENFLENGLMNGIVPVDQATFDEEFYVSYYADVAEAIARGQIPSGYYHYVLAGRAENRQPVYDMAKLLKAKLGDAAEPIGFSRVIDIQRRIKPVPSTVVSSRAPTVNVFIPTLDGDIMFGGYIAFLNFLCRVAEQGHRLRFIIMEDEYGSKKWFQKFLCSKPRWSEAFSTQEVVNASKKDTQIEFHRLDICIAYSCWTAHDAWSVAQNLDKKFFLFFIQEYEPIFHENDAVQFMMSSFYKLPHIAIFNSNLLMQFFRAGGHGVFLHSKPAPWMSFQHALAGIKPSRQRLARKRRRRLICYARPEKHAGRNLFEVCILALREAIRQDVFRDEWEFVGIGALGKAYEIELSARHTMTILSRVVQDDYEKLLQSFDVGLSLMWAPHPSVIPFELAKAGVVTVTNIYGIRDRDVLSTFGYNIVAASADLEGIVLGLRKAVARSESLTERIHGADFDWPTDWDTVFDLPFFNELWAKVDEFQIERTLSERPKRGLSVNAN